MRCFGLEYRVSSKSEEVRFWNWNASHVCQIVNFTCKMKFWSEILTFSAQMHKLKFSCQIMKKDVSIQKWSQFHEFWWRKQVHARMGLSMSWEVWWRKSFSSLEKCVSSLIEKWWSEWEVEFWNMEVFLTWKFWFVNENFHNGC